MNNLDYVRANIKFDNTYFRELSGFYSPVDPIHVPDPKLICFNNILGDKFDLSSKECLAIEDTEESMKSALSAKIICIAFPGKLHEKEKFKGSYKITKKLINKDIFF